MNLYHGTSINGLSQLTPCLSEHGQPYIYFSKNMVVAAFYTVHMVERPNNWFPYGFSKNGVPCYTEYYENALSDVYENKPGYIYQCADVENIENPTNINCAYACKQQVPVQSVLKIRNMYRWFLEQEHNGELHIAKFSTLTKAQHVYREKMIIAEITNCKLRESPHSSYSEFISNRFPEIWINS